MVFVLRHPTVTHDRKSGSIVLPVLAGRMMLVAVALVLLFVGSYSLHNPPCGETAAATIATTSASLSGEVERSSSSSSVRKQSTATTTTSSSSSHPNWPGVPVEAIGHELVKKGTSFVDRARELLLEHLDEFLDVYEARPDKVNLCGIRFNHAYALYLTVKVLQPQSIIESGVNAGQSTYFMRAAAPPNAHIYAIDPLDEPICGQEKRWMDDPATSTYYTGPAHFLDFGAIDWDAKIRAREIDPSNTLVFLDDHRRVFDRWNDIMRFGFRHVLLEDNYKANEGATREDKAGWTPKQLLTRTDADAQFLWHSLDVYAEFPPLVSPVLSVGRGDSAVRKAAGGFLHHKDHNHDIVAPLLRPELPADQEDKRVYQKICDRLKLDPEMLDNDSYMQILNYNQFAYMQVRPASPYLLSLQEKKFTK